jgi:enterochelin esterase-like enzyme
MTGRPPLRQWWKLVLAAISLVLCGSSAWAANAGKIVEMPRIRSVVLPPQRVRVWLPQGYHDGSRRYGVIYVQDGQWAFRSGAKDNENFAIERSVARLTKAGRIQPVIIVAVDNPGNDRFRQFLPQTIYDGSTGLLRSGLDKELAGQPVTSGAFLHFLAHELKPRIDAEIRTRPDAEHTTVIGASMAGLISAAAFIEHPDVFGRAASISPQWPLYDLRMIDHPQLLKAWPAYFARVGRPAGRKFWLDRGTTMIDAGYGPYQEAIARQLERQGWKRGADLKARVYQGGAHTWADWAAHMDELLDWLLT